MNTQDSTFTQKFVSRYLLDQQVVVLQEPPNSNSNSNDSLRKTRCIYDSPGSTDSGVGAVHTEENYSAMDY